MSFTEAITIESEAEVRDDTSAELAAAGVDDRGFPQTSTQRQILDSHAASLARLTELRANATKAGTIELIQEIPETDGRDDWIRKYFSLGYFGLPADEATKAQHRLVLTNSAVGLERQIATGALRARAGSIDFINKVQSDPDATTSGTLPVGGTLALTFEAQTAGSIGNLPPNTITQLVTAIAGVTINNPPIAGVGSSIVVPARDAESNQTLLDRDMARWGATSSGGSRGSIVEWIDEAFKYAGVTKLVTKWGIDDENPYGPGSTGVYLATPSGGAPSPQIDVVDAYLRLRRTAGTGALVVMPATDVFIQYIVQVKTAISFAQTIERLLAVDAGLTAEVPIGGKVLGSEIIRRIKNAIGSKTDEDVKLVGFVDAQLAPFENAVFESNPQIV